MTVMAGCGSSMSSGPQTAVNLTSREARLPDNLKASMSDATQHPSVSSLNHFCECKRRCLAGRELLFGVQKMWWKIPKYFLLLAGSRFKHGSSSFTVRICVALAAIQTTGKPAIFQRYIAKTGQGTPKRAPPCAFFARRLGWLPTVGAWGVRLFRLLWKTTGHWE